MLAPSPDWFVGVHGLNLLDQGAWLEEVVVDLFVYDAGTDSGSSYTAANEDTQPAENIFLIETPPFLINDVVESVGTFTFRLLSAVSNESPEQPTISLQLTPPFPNPFSAKTQFTVQSIVAEHVTIEVYDILGRKVETVFEGTLPAGSPQVFTFDGSALPNGYYMARVASGQSSTTRSILLQK